MDGSYGKKPFLSLRDMKDLISPNGPFFVDQDPTNFHHFRKGFQPTEDNFIIRDFVREVKKYRYMAFDTEGAGNTLYGKSGEKDRVFVQYGSFRNRKGLGISRCSGHSKNN